MQFAEEGVMLWAQRTLKDAISSTGIGLHSGHKVHLKIKPALPNSGIIFVRTDLPKRPQIKAHIQNVISSNLATTLGQNGVSIGTVEHLLAALGGLGVDNALVEVNGPELPIMDGSAAPFLFLLKSVGLKAQFEPKKVVIIEKSLRIKEDDRWIYLTPASTLSITSTIAFNHPLLQKQSYAFNFSTKSFEKEISRARTFGFLKDVEQLWANGLALGGSLDNAVVIDDFRVINEEGLRYKDEFVRHKILDLIGDLMLLGYPLVAKIKAYKAGHALNHKLMERLWAQKKYWKIVTLEPKKIDSRVHISSLG